MTHSSVEMPLLKAQRAKAPKALLSQVFIVMNHQLQEISFTKETSKKYIKGYMKSIKSKLEEQRPERVKPFVKGVAEKNQAHPC